MNEREFWNFLESLQGNGRAKVVAGSIDAGKENIDAAGDYMTGHALLPADHDSLSRETIDSIGKLLFINTVKIETKEAILILLAHQPRRDALIILEKYNRNPDKKLKIFAELALDECVMWNE